MAAQSFQVPVESVKVSGVPLDRVNVVEGSLHSPTGELRFTIMRPQPVSVMALDAIFDRPLLLQPPVRVPGGGTRADADDKWMVKVPVVQIDLDLVNVKKDAEVVFGSKGDAENFIGRVKALVSN